MKKVSVIMGTYNSKSKEALVKSVKSIIQQIYPEWQLIICDDGSTDDTLNELKKIEQLDSRIEIYSYEKNVSLANALNECIKHASGEYIARQDDDDLSYPDRIQMQVKFLDENAEYAFVGSNADVFDQNGVWGEYLTEEMPSKRSFLWSNPFAHPTVMIRKEALADSGGYRVSRETRRCEDYDLFMRMYAKGYKGYNIQNKLYKYRINENEKQKHRPMKYRIDESIVRFKGYRNMRLGVACIPYIFKPIVLGIIPQFLFKSIRKSQYSNKEER